MTEVKPLSDETEIIIASMRKIASGPDALRAIYSAEFIVDHILPTITALKSENEKLRVALSDLVSDPLRYNGNRIEIDCASHAAAMGRVMRARAALAEAPK